MSKRWWSALCVAGLMLLSAPLTAPAAGAEKPIALTIPAGPTSALDSTSVKIDADLYIPQQTPAPAVLLAHGFGGSKASLTEQAQQLQDAGYVVLAYTARGFGKSGGLISMNSPDFEVADARKLVDYLATRQEVRLDKQGDPRIGVAGGSYGGALALMLAGYDNRVDAVSSDITWNNLDTALFPQNIVGSQEPGVFKKLWAGFFFSVGLVGGPQIGTCGRFAPQWCALYEDAATTGTASEAERALAYASSPASVADRINAPTLLTSGQADSLFPLSEATATAQQIAVAHPKLPMKVVWHSGGHDGGVDESARLHSMTQAWFDEFLMRKGSVSRDFEVTFNSGSVISTASGNQSEVFAATDFPGRFGTSNETVKLRGPMQPVMSPAGGAPAAITVVPGIGGAVASVLGITPVGQGAYFESKSLTSEIRITGSSKVTLRLSSPMPVSDVALFASLRVVAASGREVLPNGLVAPIHLAQLGPVPTEVKVTLPTVALLAKPGEKLRLVVSTTDLGYKLPDRPAVYFVELPQKSVTLPIVQLTSTTEKVPLSFWLFGTLLAVLLIVGAVVLLRPRHPRTDNRPEFAEVPVRIEHLVKEFKGGVRAVDDISWDVPAGEVIGLLGPNGAGKTTTMRMAMGLIHATEGHVFVYGERAYPGAPVLARIGSLVEGSGFLPHLTGRENLEIYWRASGRAIDPRFDEVLEISDLGTAADRKVRTYSQGMRQRLGIAQAMLGMPDLLMLDEPTNGLDPPQIRAMREVLHKYAATGRTVLISSHMLSEVEQTCTYVVVMHRGRLVTRGEVKELLGHRAGQSLEEFFMEVVGDDLTVGKS